MQKDEEIAAKLLILSLTPVAVLRQNWIEQFRKDPPKAFGPDLLRRGLAQAIQEKAYGGLSATTRKFLNQLIAQNAKGKIMLPRQIKAGSMLVREWRGKRYQAVVTTDGFIFEGKTFSSLSEIARLITGARWNGPRFFGLRQSSNEDELPGANNGT